MNRGYDAVPAPVGNPLEPAPPATAELQSSRTVTLWHPDSPGVRVTVRPCLLRRLRIIRSEFATLGEVVRMYRLTVKQYSA